MEYFANVHRLAVTDKPLYHYLENPASATHRYMRDYPAVFARFLERKAEIVEKYGLDAARPQWRANTVWAGPSAPSRSLRKPSGNYAPRAWAAISRSWRISSAAAGLVH